MICEALETNTSVKELYLGWIYDARHELRMKAFFITQK